MIVEINVRLNYHLPQSHDVLLQIEAAAMEDQHLISSRLMVSSACDLVAVAGEELIGQRTWASGLGNFVVDYDCAVELKICMELLAWPKPWKSVTTIWWNTRIMSAI